MKITKSQLKQMIKEELGAVNEISELDHLLLQLTRLEKAWSDARARGDREARDTIIDQMIEVENTILDAGGKLPPFDPEPDSTI